MALTYPIVDKKKKRPFLSVQFKVCGNSGEKQKEDTSRRFNCHPHFFIIYSYNNCSIICTIDLTRPTASNAASILLTGAIYHQDDDDTAAHNNDSNFGHCSKETLIAAIHFILPYLPSQSSSFCTHFFPHPNVVCRIPFTYSPALLSFTWHHSSFG